jgi:uncharacterized LabA/DUF88 family protein
VHYFSALAKHIERYRPEVVARHRTYLRALEHTGVQDELADFKGKPRNINLADCSIRLRWFRRKWQLRTRAVTLSFRTYEEKETDVAVACKVLELLHTGACDSVAVISGDTDIAPAIRTARRLYPAAEVVSVLPYLRHNHALARIARRTVKIGQALRCSESAASSCGPAVITAAGDRLHQWVRSPRTSHKRRFRGNGGHDLGATVPVLRLTVGHRRQPVQGRAPRAMLVSDPGGQGVAFDVSR